MMLLLVSCDEINTVTVSVADEFSAEGNGTMVLTTEKEGDDIQLKGSLELIYGMFTVCLTGPSMDTLFLKTWAEPGKFTLDEKFTREMGDFTFSYSIRKEESHLPEGSFDFDLTCKN